MTSDFSARTLYAITFLEGAVVMAIEILGARILAPFFGTSLIVWTSVIAVTLISLTGGYYLGGVLSIRKNLPDVLFFQVLIVAIFIGFMATWATRLYGLFVTASIYSGSVICALLVIGPPLVTLSSTTPVIIKLLTKDPSGSGKAAGTVYAVSTTGGIIFTLLTGFFIIPVFGISVPLLIFAGILLAAALSAIPVAMKRKLTYGGGALLLFLFQTAGQAGKKRQAGRIEIPYVTEGLMGQLKVVDRHDPGQNLQLRHLLINGIPQTRIVNDDYAVSFWKYVHLVAMYASLKNGSPSVLLCGFGGGSIATELCRMNMKVDAVEIDGRMLDISKNYFHFRDTALRFIADDGRHYIRTTDKKYDLIVFDVLNGEVQPSYMFTVESFNEMKNLLNPGGMILIEFQELFMNGELFVYKSISNTMEASGFHAWHSPDYFTKDPLRDVILIGSVNEIDFSALNSSKMTPCCAHQPWLKDVLVKPAETHGGLFPGIETLADDKPVLDHLKTETQKVWRENMRADFTRLEMEEGRRLFR
ncbi:MAG: fused MFS/spermidine synthase [Bacteroidetes bacterium]|nr:fused MFS/spermidine synthase [Bacteroidota bacterium]